MSERYGFFDSKITGYDENNMPLFDRAEKSDFFAGFYGTLFGSGISRESPGGLAVTAGDGLEAKIAPGRAVLRGYFYSVEDDPVVLPVAPNPSPATSRIDSIVARLDIQNRTIRAAVIQGTPAAFPSAPAPVRNLDIFDLVLAQVRVNYGEAFLASVTDTRYDSVICGFVSTKEQPDADILQTSGTAGAYTVSTLTVNELRAGMRIFVRFHAANTSPTVTLDINGYGAKRVYLNGSADPSVNFFSSDSVWQLTYTGTAFQLISNNGLNINKRLVATYTSSGIFKPSDYGLDGKTVDVFMVAGGQGGAGGLWTSGQTSDKNAGSNGGNGGGCVFYSNIPMTQASYQITIGAGGAGRVGGQYEAGNLQSAKGKQGGSTSAFGLIATCTNKLAMDYELYYPAFCGQGGHSSLPHGQAGQLCAVKNPYDLAAVYGAGGGGGYSGNTSGKEGSGSLGNGGAGATAQNTPGGNASGYGGGGGGGGDCTGNSSSAGGNGSPGILLIYA